MKGMTVCGSKKETEAPVTIESKLTNYRANKNVLKNQGTPETGTDGDPQRGTV
ncbi:MAG: hypothetical protein K2G58_02160 [Alistipes sp.]|nr:hypothetical protein [Alistipes sp.]